MASPPEKVSMALFCDFENVALGVRDANYEKFDIAPVLERLLLKGSIVVKKAYCDWERYKGFKAAMHEANFELIEIPHVRQSGKNSADIRLVVDALDLCYTKSHVNTFVIISGDSDFSPLVSKLRENAKHVIGVGVKQSTSDLLVANCDDFIFYDDLVREMARETARGSAKRETRETQPAAKRTPDEEKRRRQEADNRKSKGVDIAVQTFDALLSERGDSGKIWASVLKDAIKRRKPDFNESYYGFRAFGNLLEEAQRRGLLEIGRDEKSGAFVFRNSAGDAQNEDKAEQRVPLEAVSGTYSSDAAEVANGSDDSASGSSAPVSSAPGALTEAEGQKKVARKTRGGRKPAVKKPKAGGAQESSVPSQELQAPAQTAALAPTPAPRPATKPAPTPTPAPELAAAPKAPAEGAAAKKPRTSAARSRRPRKAAPPQA